MVEREIAELKRKVGSLEKIILEITGEKVQVSRRRELEYVKKGGEKRVGKVVRQEKERNKKCYKRDGENEGKRRIRN